MPERKTIRAASPAEAQEIARYIISKRYEYFGTWADVAGEFGINRGLLCAISKGKRRASERVLLALGIVAPVYVPAPCCPNCGKVPLKRKCGCTAKPKPAGPRRVRYSERDTLAALGAVVRAVVGVMYGRKDWTGLNDGI